MGSFCRRSFASASIRSPFRLFLPLHRCPFLMRGFLLPPSLQKGGMMGGGLGCPSVASRGPSSPPARLLSSGRGGGASGRSFGAHELASVSAVHSWTGEARVTLLRRTPATLSVLADSPSSSVHALRGNGAEESSGAFSVLGCLFRLISALSARW